MTQMRAARVAGYGDIAQLHIDTIDIPAPGPGQLRVRVHAASVNPIDAKLRAGYLRAVVRKQLPFTPGMDLSGVIDALGAGVTRFQVGDAVFASPSHRTMGAHADYCCLDAREAAKKPANLSHLEAASIPLAGLTAWDALVRHGKLQAGQRVLIQAGAGGVGTLAIQLARALGAEVWATCSETNLELVRSLGATPIDYRRERYEDIARGFDLIVDSLGPADARLASRTVRSGGRVVSLASGMPENVQRHGPYLGAVCTGVGMLRMVAGARMRRVKATPINRKPDGEALAALAGYLERGQIRPLIDSRFPLERLGEAHARVETGRARGKVVIQVV